MRDGETNEPRAPGSRESSSEQIGALLSSPEFIEALQSEHFKIFLDNLPIGILVAKMVRSEERIIYSNSAFEGLTGLDSDTIHGRTWSVLDHYTRDGDPEIQLGRAIINEDEFLGTFRAETKNGERADLEAYVTKIESTETPGYFRLTVLVDVTKRDLSDREDFDRQLRDKDMQLKEIQHRVRNSLQIVTALVRLEGRNAREGRTPDFETVASRIEALSLLYTALSARENLRTIDLGEYLSAIASATMRSHAREGIQLAMKVESCPVSINIAMPTGLIVNEVMTNAFKHAFASRETGTIELLCVNHDDRCSISIADNGSGLPLGTTWPPAGKIAALIVRSLEENARTKVVVESDADKGTRVGFVVPRLAPGEAGS